MGKDANLNIKRTSIGGQALLEGLMMIGPRNVSIAVRKPNGEIEIKNEPLSKNKFIAKIPFVRGSILLVKQMILGIKALMYSADFIDIEEDNPSKVDMFINKIFGDKFKDAIIYMSVALSLFFSVGVFMLLPNVISGLLNFNRDTTSGLILYNLLEGIIRVSLFLIYLLLTSRISDIKRVWQYHGAEHKTIHCYESGEELTVENIKKYSTKHPRCGTSFLFTVMIVSILVFSFTGWHSVIINVLIRLLLVPLVAGISYEIVKLAGRSNSIISRVVSLPGIMFQKFTTREPDEKQIEVAIAAMSNILIRDESDDKW